jgi:hypothetical protein
VVIVILDADVQLHVYRIGWRSKIFDIHVERIVPVELVELSSGIDTRVPRVNLLQHEQVRT